MALDSTHPMYQEFKDDWVTMRDLYKGSRRVKAKDLTYLPATQGMRIDGMSTGQRGREAYDAYKLRAVFPEYVEEAVEAYIGLLHQKPATIELPTVMEPLRERVTAFGEPLMLLLRRINEEQLVTGRLGLLLDLPVDPDPSNPLPYIALYTAESIRNWDDGEAEEGEARLNMVVLDESGPVRVDKFEWDNREKYRVLLLGDVTQNEAEGVSAFYRMGVFESNKNGIEYNDNSMAEPMLRGAKLEKIPFVFVNTKDIVSSPDKPPLLRLGNICLTIYRGEADYRQNLFMQGQDTFVTIGAHSEQGAENDGQSLRTGAGSLLEIELGGDAKYVGVTSEGLSEQRSAVANDRARAEHMSGQLVNESGSQVESGEALKTRIGAQTATLNQIALTGAAALEQILKICAEWMGADPEQVKVTPNTEFGDFDMTGKDLVDLMAARSMGAPLSRESIHNLLVDRGLTKLDYQTEIDKIAEEDALNPPPGTGAGGNPDDGGEDE